MKLLIIAFVWPEPASTAAGNRMLQLIHYFLDSKYQITVASTASESELSMDLLGQGIQKEALQLNHSSFDDFVSKLQPNIVLFDRFLTEEQFGWRVAEFAPKALRILDTEDLHSLRQTREKCHKKGISFTTDAWLNADITKREIASIYRSDISLIISSYEMHLLQDVVGMNAAILMYLPFLLDEIAVEEMKSWTPFENRTDFVCIGNGKHAPNIDAIIWLKTKIWPLIRKQLPNVNLKIYGAYLPEQIQQMHKPQDGFFIEGWAPDARAVLQQAKVNLAPLRFGAGLKGKLIAAMQNGLPSVTTPIGAEGMHSHLDFGGSIADSTHTFAEAAIELYLNQSLWQTAQDDGADLINMLYKKEDWIEKLNTKITAVQNTLEPHRIHNFTGAMLLHHTMASTKYMSKWIAEKENQ